MTILIVEDNTDTQFIASKSLGQSGHTLLTATTARQAVQALATQRVDLIILDLALPDLGGLELFAQIRADKKTESLPVIVLTGTTDVYTKVAAFSMGVDDYVVKPFNPLELRARVEARLRKVSDAREREEILVKDGLHLNLSRQSAEIQTGGSMQDLLLTPLEFKLLYQLMRNEERILSRDRLLDLVWGTSTEVHDRTVDSHISTLRKKLGRWGDAIRAVPGEGYRFSTKSGAQAA